MRHGSPRLNEVGSATGFPKETMIPQKASMRPGSGEEIVYRRELLRVKHLGYDPPEDYVIWTSRNEPLADHDIK
jgi:hypothetical protein